MQPKPYIYFTCIICMNDFQDAKMCKICQKPICNLCSNKLFFCPTCKSREEFIQINKKAYESLFRHIPKCPKHPEIDCKYYCETCDTGVCEECILNVHRTHKNISFNYKHFKNLEKELNEAVTKCNSLKNKLNEKEDELKAKIQSFKESQYKELDEFIKEEKQRIHFAPKDENEDKLEELLTKLEIMKNKINKILTNNKNSQKLVEYGKHYKNWEKELNNYKNNFEQIKEEKQKDNGEETNVLSFDNLFPPPFVMEVTFSLQSKNEFSVSHNVRIAKASWGFGLVLNQKTEYTLYLAIIHKCQNDKLVDLSFDLLHPFDETKNKYFDKQFHFGHDKNNENLNLRLKTKETQEFIREIDQKFEIKGIIKLKIDYYPNLLEECGNF